MKHTTVASLLATPDRWCQGNRALTEDCRGVDDCHPAACRWCLLGAIGRVYEGAAAYAAAVDKVAAVLPENSAAGCNGARCWLWNDASERTHADVIAAVTAAGI